MNLIAILSLVVIIAFALGLSPVLGHWFDKGPFFFLLPVVVSECLLMWLVLECLRKGQYPKCKSARCRITNKDIVPCEDVPAGITFKCQCGQLYCLQGNRFLEMNPDSTGGTREYMVRRNRLAPWRKDAQHTEGSKNGQERIQPN